MTCWRAGKDQSVHCSRKSWKDPRSDNVSRRGRERFKFPAEPNRLSSSVGASNRRSKEVKDLRKALRAQMTLDWALDDTLQPKVRIFFDVKERSASAIAAENVGVSGQVIAMVSTFGQCRMMVTRVGRDSTSGLVGPPR